MRARRLKVPADSAHPDEGQTMSFRDNLQHLRAERNMTQEQLAMLLGVSRQSKLILTIWICVSAKFICVR